MNELEILKALIEQERIAQDLRLRIEIWSNNPEKIEFSQDLEKVSGQIENLRNQLLNIENKSYSRDARIAMIDQFEHYITEINRVSPSLNLSRNQGLMLENELFSGIVRDINYFVTDKVFGIHIPAYLKYTTVPEDSISVPELTEFLRNEIVILRQIANPNYINLLDYKDQLIERIITQYIE
jgi:hypothetical protein